MVRGRRVRPPAEAAMAYTVKEVAQMSGVSVRMLRFYDQTGVLPPAYHGANGYRYYNEPQLLTLQQILFYRELGLDLKEIKRIHRQTRLRKDRRLAVTSSHPAAKPLPDLFPARHN
jgi:DNA-binding transcriptional MerR regulator